MRKRGDDEKFEAEVLARATDCDLAILTVRDESFWTGSLSAQTLCSDVPALFSEVVCVGYPTGGDNLCVTKGVVSRLDYEENPDPWRNRLVIQIDAAVNPGNSGGPALIAGGRCVGVAYESLKDGSTENIGFIIPVSVVQKFLTAWRRVAKGSPKGPKSVDENTMRVTAFGHGRFSTQRLENAGMRRALGMVKGQSGVIIKSVDPTTPNAKVLQRGDVLLSLAGVPIGNDGCVPFVCGSSRHDRVPFPYVAIDKFVGESLDADILRNGTQISCTVELLPQEPLVSVEKEAPWLLDYCIIGGLVFVVLSRQYLRATFGEKWKKERCNGLAEILDSREREFPDEQVVVLSYVLSHTINLGFQDVRNARLKAFVGNDGKPMRIRNLAHLSEVIDSFKGEHLRFELFGRGRELALGVCRGRLLNQTCQHGFVFQPQQVTNKSCFSRFRFWLSPRDHRFGARCCGGCRGRDSTAKQNPCVQTNIGHSQLKKVLCIFTHLPTASRCFTCTTCICISRSDEHAFAFRCV